MITSHLGIPETRKEMLDRGLVFGSQSPGSLIASGIQIDINTVLRNGSNGVGVPVSVCDHDCTTVKGGGYDCPAAFSLNKGAKSNFASADSIVGWLVDTRVGIGLAYRNYVSGGGFAHDCGVSRYPPNVASVLRESMLSGIIEVNLFGGNPEMHPELIEIIQRLHEQQFRINLTTTGRRILRDQNFRDAMCDPATAPHLIAVSADDCSIDELQSTLAMDLNTLYARWRDSLKDPLGHGQVQKFLEGVWVSKFAQQRQERGEFFPFVLFNMVLHKHNLETADRIIQALQAMSDKVIVNPYPAQTSFDPERSRGPFDAEDIKQFDRLTEYFIEEALKSNPQLTKRLHYWILMQAALRTYWDDWQTLSDRLAGHGLWHCARNNRPGYVQISGAPVNGKPIKSREPGGHLGCFWDDRTVRHHAQISGPDQVNDFLSYNRRLLYESAPDPCPGCIMPRLMFDLGETEAKMDPAVRERYLDLRRRYVGF